MEEVTAADRDIDSIPPRDSAAAHNASDITHNGEQSENYSAPVIKEEHPPAPGNGDDGGVIERPPKRRKLEDTTPRRSASRAVSPPWKSFVADGPTTVFENGVRKSSRVSKDAAPPTPEPVKRNSRPASKATQTNGTPKSGVKRESRNGSGPMSVSKGKTPSTITKKASAQSLATPARKSERQRKPSGLATTSPVTSPALQNGSPEGTRKRVGRARRGAQPLTNDLGDEPMDDVETNGHDPYAGLYGSPDDSNPSMPAPRLRLRLRKPDPPNRHPHHAPPKSEYASLEEWLGQDDPLDGEEALRITQEKAEEEARRRLQIVEAAEHGVLSQARCSVYAPEAAPEPPPQYGHWDHVVAHVLHFNKLLKEEKAFHRRTAKILAREAYDFWKNKFKRKSQDEIEQEETERQVTRYKQLVKDVKDAWGLVRVEIDKERVAKYEEEQLQLGHKAMDDMFNQAQEILGGRNAGDGASSLVSEDRDFDEMESESGVSHASQQQLDDDVMSSSSDSEQENEQDEDANLTAEQLREKYGQLPDLPESSSEVEANSDDGEDDDDADSEEGTPAPTPDPDLEVDNTNELPENPFQQTNGFHDHDDEDEDKEKPDYIDPATVELDQVDDALLDSDDDKGSESGSEAWSSNEGSDSEGNGDEAADSEEDDEDESEGEDLGMMGFLAPKDIKKLKEAAKTAIDDVEPEDPTSHSEQTNGHAALPEEVSEEKPHVNGHDSVAEADEPHVNGHTETEPAPSVEAAEPTPIEDVVHSKSASRSRHTSSPPRTEVPSLLRGTLREYQHDGLDWLANLYESETNGILADEMGLGKTIQTISLLAYLAVRREIWGPHLVVVPTSVMLNWEMEFKKFLPGFKILTYYGDINERKRKRLGWRNTGKDMYNVVITSYQLILQDAAAFKMRPWRYLVLDEAHNIKNFKSQRWQTMLNLRTERRLLLTGTPLQNNIDELWSLLYFLMPAGFAGEGRIAGLEEFTLALKNPTSQILDQGRQQLDAEAQKVVKRLHEVLRPYLLRRLKSEVEKQMPGKYEHVVYCKLSKRQRQLYDGFMGRASTKEILSSGNYMSIINCLMSLRKVCNHPDLFETRAIVTSMAMPKSVAAQYEIKDLLIRKRLQEGMEDKQVNLDALNLVFARREQTQLGHARRTYPIRATRPLEDLIERQTRRINKPIDKGTSSLQATMAVMAKREQVAVRDHLQTCLNLTRARTQFMPIYGKDIIDALTVDWHDFTFGAITEGKRVAKPLLYRTHHTPHPNYHGFGQAQMQPRQEEAIHYDIVQRHHGLLGFRSPRSHRVLSHWHDQQITHFYDMIPTLEQRADSMEPLITRFTCVTPAVAAEELAPLTLSRRGVQLIRSSEAAHQKDPFHSSRIRQSIAFPDKRLLQYDCGKLQRLATLLRDLQAGGHRALIFTQMTKVLDILEQFLNIHGYRYLRLDGSTKIEQRQILTDRFNSDPRILCFILSSRSGGLGINLTGADSVIFYDLDWNPAMDKQCQDRAHRIGQTRDVHIYKFVSEYTIEANILRKSNQKRLLDDVIIQKGDFTTDTFNKVTWRDALDENLGIDTNDEAGAAMERVLGEKIGLLGDARVMGTVEDTEDRTAASIAQKEIVDEIQEDQVDFNESLNATRAASEAAAAAKANEDLDVNGNEKERRHVDEYMLSLYREEYGKEPYRPPTDRQKRNRKGQDPHVRHRKKKY
ncbi:helicase swr1 [Alternaria rosae]|uniref:helicase swr1 n=1 Tax=Alternaria rosae TaxID=1187941 RepID=UPI001E8D154D|nr:helicase swr1 [Alternaria rosae]KAH6878754.1 helicase swr1 [Alternaria rosae]